MSVELTWTDVDLINLDRHSSSVYVCLSVCLTVRLLVLPDPTFSPGYTEGEVWQQRIVFSKLTL